MYFRNRFEIGGYHLSGYLSRNITLSENSIGVNEGSLKATCQQIFCLILQCENYFTVCCVNENGTCDLFNYLFQQINIDFEHKRMKKL